MEATSKGTTIKAINNAALQPNGALAKVTVATAPANGTVAVTADKLVYTPKANFNGKDSFTYVAEDTAGVKIAPTTVNVTVNAVNDAPTVTGGSVSANEGETVVLTATGADVDGDALTYTWTQKSGPTISLNVAGNKATLVAPAVSSATTATFEVVAKDASASSAPAVVTLNIADIPEKDGGAGGLLGLLLLPVALLRRKFKM